MPRCPNLLRWLIYVGWLVITRLYHVTLRIPVVTFIYYGYVPGSPLAVTVTRLTFTTGLRLFFATLLDACGFPLFGYRLVGFPVG